MQAASFWSGTYPNLVAPDTRHAGLTESIEVLARLARGLEQRASSQMRTIATAVEQAAIDTYRADHAPPPEPVVDVPTGTTTTSTTTTTTSTIPVETAEAADGSETPTGTTSSVPTTTTTTTTTLPAG